MKITDQAAADAYLEECVQHNLESRKLRGEPQDRAAAQRVELSNLGYYAGYYDSETRERVERLFRCSHPVFGSIAENGAPTPEQAFKAGMSHARKTKAA